MTTAVVSTPLLPVVAVLYRVPLLVEALRAAFDGIARLQPLHLDDAGVESLLAALAPSALVVETSEAPDVPFAGPMLHVDLERGTAAAASGGAWLPLPIELSPESIRAAVVTMIVGGAR